MFSGGGDPSSGKKRAAAEAVIIEEPDPEVHPPEFPELDEAGGCL